MDVAEIIANFDEELANAHRELLENALFLETEQRLQDTQTYHNFVDLSFPPTTSPLIPSPIISNSSECLYGSPQASTDTQGTLKFKSEEENEPISPREHPVGEMRVNEILMQDNYCDFFVLDTNFHFPELEGKYFVLEQAGEGTFSTVYKAISLMKENSVVALKRISPKCSPERILREMQLFRVLGGKGHVPPLLDVMRFRDQVTLVLPFIEHQKFKDFMPMMEVDDIRNYMKSLFESLAYIHSWYIIHRDLKPGNFLYNPQTKTCALVDFGLAQVEISKTIRTSSPSTLKRKRTETMVIESSKLPYIPTHRPKPTTFRTSGENDIQIEMKTLHASRGGTRGFRAPEVLLKHQNQTVAIDVWSAGVILLSILSTRYPFFSAPDDLSSLAEIASLCGTKELQESAILLNRKIHFPFEAPKQILKHVCKRLSGRRYEMPEEAFHLLERCLDLNPITRITAQEALNHPFLN